MSFFYVWKWVNFLFYLYVIIYCLNETRIYLISDTDHATGDVISTRNVAWRSFAAGSLKFWVMATFNSKTDCFVLRTNMLKCVRPVGYLNSHFVRVSFIEIKCLFVDHVVEDWYFSHCKTCPFTCFYYHYHYYYKRKTNRYYSHPRVSHTHIYYLLK